MKLNQGHHLFETLLRVCDHPALEDEMEEIVRAVEHDNGIERQYPEKPFATDINGPQNWNETSQWIVVNFLRMPDEQKQAVLDKIAPADKRINHFTEFLKDDYGIELPDRVVSEYLKYKAH